MSHAPSCGSRRAEWLDICKAPGARFNRPPHGSSATWSTAHSPHTWNVATRKHTKELTPTPNCLPGSLISRLCFFPIFLCIPFDSL